MTKPKLGVRDQIHHNEKMATQIFAHIANDRLEFVVDEIKNKQIYYINELEFALFGEELENTKSVDESFRLTRDEVDDLLKERIDLISALYSQKLELPKAFVYAEYIKSVFRYKISNYIGEDYDKINVTNIRKFFKEVIKPAVKSEQLKAEYSEKQSLDENQKLSLEFIDNAIANNWDALIESVESWKNNATSLQEWIIDRRDGVQQDFRFVPSEIQQAWDRNCDWLVDGNVKYVNELPTTFTPLEYIQIRLEREIENFDFKAKDNQEAIKKLEQFHKQIKNKIQLAKAYTKQNLGR